MAGIFAAVPSFTVTRRFRFSAAHYLPEHPGDCRNVHGHNWSAYVTCELGELRRDGGQQGMVIEIDRLKDVWENLLGALDHSTLNDRLPVDYQPPTTENVAAFILSVFTDALMTDPCRVVSVRVVETENNEATAWA